MLAWLCPAAVLVLALADLAVPASGQVVVPGAPVYALDGRAIAGANRIIGRTRFHRFSGSPVVHELAIAAGGKRGRQAATHYEAFFRNRLAAFLNAAPALGLRTDDAGDARACFVQVAFKVYNGQSFGDSNARLTGPGLWGEGAIAGMTRASSSFARLQFTMRLKYLMGTNKRFAALDDRGKQRIYDLYAIDSEVLIESWQAAVRGHDTHERSFVRQQARRQLRADLGMDPERVRFTASGIEVDGSTTPKGPSGKRV